jgi:hypothetical protein
LIRSEPRFPPGGFVVGERWAIRALASISLREGCGDFMDENTVELLER